MNNGVTAMLLSTAMVIGLLTGCGQGDAGKGNDLPSVSEQTAVVVDYTNNPNWFGTDDGETVTLNFYCGIQPEYGYQQMVDKFNAEYLGGVAGLPFRQYAHRRGGDAESKTARRHHH